MNLNLEFTSYDLRKLFFLILLVSLIFTIVESLLLSSLLLSLFGLFLSYFYDFKVSFKIYKTHIFHSFLLFLLIILLYYSISFFDSLFGFGKFYSIERIRSFSVLVIFYSLFFTPILEELVFRVIPIELYNKYFGGKTSIFFVFLISLMFGFFHLSYSFFHFLFAFFSSFVFGSYYLNFKNVSPLIFAHFFINLVSALTVWMS